jgi:uncharacterized protein (TIGR02996 family)
MTERHSFLQSAWEAEDAGVLLVFADWLQDHGDPGTAELLRLTVEEAGTARYSPERTVRLRSLREEARKATRASAWPHMAVESNSAAVSFSRRLVPERPGQECIVVRLDKRTVRWMYLEVEGEDEVIVTRDGRTLLRRVLSPVALRFIQGGGRYWGAAFSLGEDFFPLPEGWQSNAAEAFAERRRRAEEALAPAVVPLAELPEELIPSVAWVLCDYLCDRNRRACEGGLPPGAHLFAFSAGQLVWRHHVAVAKSHAREAASVLRTTSRAWLARRNWARAGEVLAFLLVRVSDTGRLTARKLVWSADDMLKETDNLPNPHDTLPAEAFGQAVADLKDTVASNGGEVGRFAEALTVDTSEKLLALFAAVPRTEG